LCRDDVTAPRGEVVVLGSALSGSAVVLHAPLGLGPSEKEMARFRHTLGPDVEVVHVRACCCLARAGLRAENSRAFLARRGFVLRGDGKGYPRHPRLLDQLRYAVEGAL
jgi:hypothetical protein